MKKRVVSLLLCLIMALSLIPTAAFATEVADVEETTPAVETQAATDEVAVQKGGGHTYTWADAEKRYNSVDSYDHIDVRVAGSFTYETTTDGKVTNTVTKEATISNPTIILLNAGGVELRRKTFSSDAAYEWRWTGIKVDQSDIIKITCDITVDGNTMRDKTFTFSGKNDFVQAILDCDGHQGLDFNISGKDIHEILSDGKLTIVKQLNQAFKEDQTFAFNVTKTGDETFTDTIRVTVPANETTAQVTTDAKYAYGTYTVTEANADIEGYTWTAPAAQSFTIDAAHLNETLTFTNTYEQTAPATGSLTIEKVVEGLSDAEKTALLSNLQFTLAQGTTSFPGILGNNWVCNFSNLSAGNYTLSETGATVPGYKLTTTYKIGDEVIPTNDDGSILVTVNGGETATITVTNTYEKVYGETVYNPASLTIVKKDARTGAVLPNVKFTLTNAQGNSVEAITDNDGKATFNRLQPGSYTLKETGVPAGYAAWNLDLPILVKANDQPTKEELVGDKFVKTYDCTATIDVNANQNIVYYYNRMFTFEDDALVLFNEPIASVSVDVTKKVEQLGNASGEGTFTFHAKLEPQNSLGTLVADAFPGYPSDIHLYLDGTELRADNEGIYTFQLTASSKAAATAKLEVKGTMYDLYDLFVYVWEEDGTADHWTYDTEMQGFNIGYAPDTNTYTTVIGFDPVTELTFVNQYDYTYTATLDITKNVVRERGSRRPGKADFTFKASYVDPSNKEKEVLVELGSLTIKTTGGEKSYTEGWTLTIPEKAFDEEGWAVLVISEVNGKLSGWTYDKEVYTLYVSKNGEIFNGGRPQALNDEEEVSGTNLEFTNSYYKRTSSPNPPENKPVKSVKTGDMGIAMYAMTSLLSLGGAALVIKKRKDEE